jgi:hypothetical protein
MSWECVRYVESEDPEGRSSITQNKKRKRDTRGGQRRSNKDGDYRGRDRTGIWVSYSDDRDGDRERRRRRNKWWEMRLERKSLADGKEGCHGNLSQWSSGTNPGVRSLG